MKHAFLLTSGLALAAAFPQAVVAQSADFFARDRNVAVNQRGRPELEALGIRQGTILIYPSLQIDLGYDSNVLASETNEVSDTFVRLTPLVEVESDWSRHAFRATATAALTRYAEFDDENYDTWRVSSFGRIDVQRQTQITGGAEFARQIESRASSNSPQSIAEPIEFDVVSGYAGLSHIVNRLRFTGRFDMRDLDYSDGRTRTGLVIDQDGRDQKTYETLGRLDYAISPATAVYARVAFNDRQFDSPGDAVTPNRDSSGVNAIAGVNFELSNLIRGEVGVGYLEQDFDNPAYGDFSGLSTNARLEYFATPLLTIGLTADRSVGDSGVIGTAGFLVTSVQVTADYELRRNIIVGARLGRAVEEFDEIDRENERFFGGVRLTYLMNRRLGVTATYDFESRDSSGLAAINDFTANRVLLSLVAQY